MKSIPHFRDADVTALVDDDGLIASSLRSLRADDPYEDDGDDLHRQMLRSLDHLRVGDPAPVDRVICSVGLYGRK